MSNYLLREALAKAADEIERFDPASAVAGYCRGLLAESTKVSETKKQKVERYFAMWEFYNAGSTLEDTAARFGVHLQTVRNAFAHIGKPARKKAIRKTDHRAEQFWQEYCTGATLEQIGIANKITRERVRQILKRAGHEPKSVKRPEKPEYLAAIDAYLSGESLHTAAHIAGVAQKAMFDIIVRNGHKPRPSRRYFRGDQHRIETVARLYKSGAKLAVIAAEAGLAHPNNVYRYLGYAGLKPTRQTARKVA